LSQEAEYEISLRLGKAAEFRDQETGMHTRRISELSKHLGMLAGFSEDQCEVLRKASPLHDVGKIGIPDSILLKPGRLETDEFETMKRHTTIGGALLSDSGLYPLLSAGAVIALQHHEKWDGSGYPSGLKGDDIHVFARVV
jgi:putative two-component system response regulator